MAFKDYRRPTDTEWNADEVAAYLKDNGFLIGPGDIGTGVESTDEGMSVWVRVDLDANLPDDVILRTLDAYQPPEDPKRTARGYLMKRAKILNDKSTKDRTDVENDVLAILVLLGQDV